MSLKPSRAICKLVPELQSETTACASRCFLGPYSKKSLLEKENEIFVWFLPEFAYAASRHREDSHLNNG